MDASRALLGGLDGSGGTGRMRGPSPFSPRRRSVAPRISAAGACREWLSAEPALLPPRHAQSAWRGPRTRGAIGRIRAENGFRRAEPRGARREALAGESGAGQPEMGHVEGEGHAAEYDERLPDRLGYPIRERAQDRRGSERHQQEEQARRVFRGVEKVDDGAGEAVGLPRVSP